MNELKNIKKCGIYFFPEHVTELSLKVINDRANVNGQEQEEKAIKFDRNKARGCDMVCSETKTAIPSERQLRCFRVNG